MRRGPLALAAATVAVLALAPAVTPAVGAGVSAAPPRITHATATTVSSTRVALHWTNPSAADFAATIVRFKRGTTAPTPSTGVKVARLPAPHHAITVPRLVAGRRYTFALFAADGHGHFAAARILHARTGPAPVSGVSSYDLGTDVSIQWTNPLTPSFHGVVVRYAKGKTAPARPSRGQVAHLRRSKSTSVTLHNLAKGTTYSVAIWARDAAHRRSTVRTTSFTTAAAPPARGSFSGRVTDDAHHPLAGVQMYAFDTSTLADFESVTDSSGRYSLPVAAGRYEIEAYGPYATGGDGDGTGYVPDGTRVTVAPKEHRVQSFALDPGGVITGKVTDSAGHPLAGVVPLLNEPPTYLLPDSGGLLWSYPDFSGDPTTAADGTFAIHGIPTSTFVVCYDTSEEPVTGGSSDDLGYASDCQSGGVSVAPRATVTVPDGKLLGTAGGAIFGRITDRAGTGVSEAEVSVSQVGAANLGGGAVTGADGTYRVDGLAAGTYKVCVDATFVDPEPSRSGVASGCKSAVVTVTVGHASRADLSLNNGAAFEGTVTGPNGKPVVGASITLAKSRYETDFAATTDDQGRYLASGLAPGPWLICVDATNATVKGEHTGAEGDCYRRNHKVAKLKLRSGSVLDGIDFQLGRPGGEITGAVTDAGGAALAYADISISGENSDVYLETQTGRGGHYAVSGLPAGTYFVCASTQPNGGASDMHCGEPRKNVVAGKAVRRNFVFQPAGWITVSVRDEHGLAVGGIDAVVLAPCGAHNFDCPPQPVFNPTKAVSVRGSGTTDGNGRFRFGGLHAGDYAVCLFAYYAAATANDADSGYADTCSGSTLDVTVKNGHTTPVRLTLAHGGAVTGTVTDSTGHPLAGVRVHVTGAAADNYAASPFLDPDLEFNPSADSVTHADGTYRIRAVQPGAQTVCFDAAKATGGTGTAGYRDRCLSSTVTVAADTTTAGADVALTAGGAITGTVTGSGAKPVRSADVVLFHDGTYRTQLHTNATGVYRFARLPAASGYQVCVLAERYQAQCYDNVPWTDQDSAQPSSTPVTVTAGATTTAVDARLKGSSS